MGNIKKAAASWCIVIGHWSVLVEKYTAL